MTGLKGVSSVTWDDAPATKEAVEHLISIGRRRIGFFGARHGVTSDSSRFKAYKNTLEEAGLAVNEKWVFWGDSYKSLTLEQLKKIYEQPGEKPDAFFVINDAVAVRLLDLMYMLKLQAPDDIAIIGMGNLPASAMGLINLSTMDEPIEEIGCQAAETALELISSPRKGPVHKRIKHNKLKIRRTTGGDTL